MRRLLMTLSVLALFAAPAMAQRPPAKASVSQNTPSKTPEMWLYEQYQEQYQRDYNDPRVAVRRNAEFHRSQRQRRLAAMKWFGFSNQRPSASSDPFHGPTWSPTWTGNNSLYPYRWHGTGNSWVISAPRSE